MGDYIKTIMLQVELQENGIMRNTPTRRFIGRLEESEEVNFQKLSKYDIKDLGNFSDGYHTFNELYYHRMILFAVICNIFAEASWRSWKHHDGTMYDDYFIVGVDTPEGQYSYHYHKQYWDKFKFVKELDNAPEWDGHEPKDIERLLSFQDWV